jgi:hypothetical protein
MALEKYISARWEVKEILDSPSKVACFQAPTFLPPEIESFIDRLKQIIDPRFTYIHIIAMTDGDFFGSNLNGDVFTTDELTGVQSPQEAMKNPGDMRDVCLPRYKTFEQAKLYKNHANSPDDPHYGDIPCAAWNEPMRRVELIIRVAKQAIPEMGMADGSDICNKFNRRGFMTGSMGTRIAYEKCRYCGHENEFIHDRCDCLKNHMNEVMPDGRLVSAENYGVRFFDYSDVGIPADPSAFSLAKVASVLAAPNPARDARDSAPRWKSSEMDKMVPAPDPLGEMPADACPCSDAPPEDLSTDEINQLIQASGGDLSQVLSTAACSGMVMSPQELATATACAEPGKISSAGAFSGFGSLSLDKFSPSVYDLLRSKFAARSGFIAPTPGTGWEPRKLAEQGFDEMAEYYRHYRDSLRSLSQSSFTKMAHRNPYIRELTIKGDVKRAIHHLTHAGDRQ